MNVKGPQVKAMLFKKGVFAAPIGALLPLAVVMFGLIERGSGAFSWDTIHAVLAESVLMVGWLSPLLMTAVVVVSLQVERQWLAMELLGYRPLEILAPLLCAAFGLAILMGLSLYLLEIPEDLEPVKAALALETGGWRLPFSPAVWAAPDVMGLEIGQRAMPEALSWSEAKRHFFIPTALTLLAFTSIWLRLPARSVLSAALSRFVMVAGACLLSETVLGLFVQAGALDAMTGLTVWCLGMLLSGLGVSALTLRGG